MDVAATGVSILVPRPLLHFPSSTTSKVSFLIDVFLSKVLYMNLHAQTKQILYMFLGNYQLCTSRQVYTHRRLSLRISTTRRGFVVRAATSSSSPDSSHNNDNKIAPLHFQSPIGQFLSQILINHPHLVPAAVDQQLNQLQSDRQADQQNPDPPSTASTDLVLYRFLSLFHQPPYSYFLLCLISC